MSDLPAESPLNHLARVEASAELVFANVCEECAQTPKVLSIYPGTGLPRAVESRHEEWCPRSRDT